MTAPFTIKETLLFGFRAFKHNLWLLLGISLVGFSIEMTSLLLENIVKQDPLLSGFSPLNKIYLIPVHEIFTSNSQEKSSPASPELAPDQKEQTKNQTSPSQLGLLRILLIAIIKITAWLTGLFILMGWNQIGLDIYDTGTSSFSRFFIPSHKTGAFIVTYILYSLICISGIILFIIPGIIWALRYCLTDLIVVDSDKQAGEAFTISSRLTYGYKWDILFFAFIALLLILVSSITIIGPSILTYVLFLSRVYIYRKLQEQWQQEHRPPTPFMP